MSKKEKITVCNSIRLKMQMDTQMRMETLLHAYGNIFSFAHVKKTKPKNKIYHYHATFLQFLHLYKNG